jgi:putative SOS response-associated peptidase YedK
VRVMCGRYSLVCIDDLGNRFRVFNPMMGSRSRFNVAPGNEMPVIVGGEARELSRMTWGLVPHRAGDARAAFRSINARAEDIAGKPMFRHLLEDRRCLVPATGFYEWKKEGTRKIPFYFHRKDDAGFAFAGLYDTCPAPSGEILKTYTIITTEANELMAPVHDRMPAILTEDGVQRWLSGDLLSPAVMREILVPCASGIMEAYPVSPRVNSPAVDDEQLILPVRCLQ